MYKIEYYKKALKDIPKLKASGLDREDLLKAKTAPDEDFVSEDEVEW